MNKTTPPLSSERIAFLKQEFEKLPLDVQRFVAGVSVFLLLVKYLSSQSQNLESDLPACARHTSQSETPQGVAARSKPGASPPFKAQFNRGGKE